MEEPIPRQIKKLLREYSGIAYEIELRRELAALAAHFDEWKNGQMDSWELTDAIHDFHNGASRELYKKYNSGLLEFNVAHAIFTGLLDRTQIPAELLEHLARHLAFYEELH
jgi:hypothetical protein